MNAHSENAESECWENSVGNGANEGSANAADGRWENAGNERWARPADAPLETSDCWPENSQCNSEPFSSGTGP